MSSKPTFWRSLRWSATADKILSTKRNLFSVKNQTLRTYRVYISPTM